MTTTGRQNDVNGERRGFQTVELLFALPILAILLLATLGYARLVMVRFGVTQAVTMAARESGKGADMAGIALAVNAALAPYGMAVSDAAGSGTKIAVQDGSGVMVEYGDPTISAVPSGAIQPGEVLATVWIRFDAKRVDGQRLLGRPLGALADLFGGGRFCISSLAKKET